MARKIDMSRRRAAPWKPKPKEGRLHMVIDPELKRWAQEYAEKNHTSVTAIVIRHLLDLKEREKTVHAEQI